jgi:ubiquitin-activating enzyme E1
LIGKEAMHRLMNARVLISGLRGLGVEIAKNIILCGVQSVHIQDHHNITYADLSSQVFQIYSFH